MAFEVRIPTLGESVTEGTIVRWAKRDGDAVEADDVLLELETDKASMEIPAEYAGTLRILKPEGATVSVGDVVARIEDGAARDAGGTRPQAATATPPAGAPPVRSKDEAAVAAPVGAADVPGENVDRERATATSSDAVAAGAPAEREPRKSPEPASGAARGRAVGPLSPAVRHLIEEHDLDPATIPASGKGGRLTKEDVLAHVEHTRLERRASARAPSPERSASPAAVATVESAERPGGGPAASAPSRPRGASPSTIARPPAPGAVAARAGEEIVPMSRLRKRIAERLVQAQQTAAILTTFNEIDMTAVMALRSEHKERFQKRHGVALGFMSFFARASIAALQEIPAVNAEIRGDDVVYKHFVHLGVAVGTERGLVVPVVHDADRMSFAELEREIARLAALARDGKLAIDDLAGGTFTISNGGVYGSLLSTPILNPPQSGILGMHKIEKRPVVVGDEIVVRPMMYVALSYDHRLVDGEQAVTFLVRVKERLENPARLLLDL